MRRAVALVLLVTACSAEAPPDTRTALPAASVADRVAVVDGDTLRIGDETLRIANIDAPDLGAAAGCWSEAALAERSAGFLRSVVNASRDMEIKRAGEGRGGGALAFVSVDAGSDAGPRDLGEIMVETGLAAQTTGRWDWCGHLDLDAAGAPALGTPEVRASALGPLGINPDVPSAY